MNISIMWLECKYARLIIFGICLMNCLFAVSLVGDQRKEDEDGPWLCSRSDDLEISVSGGNSSASGIIYKIHCLTNKSVLLLIPRMSISEYFCEVELVDEKGAKVKRTKAGNIIGNKYNTISKSKEEKRLIKYNYDVDNKQYDAHQKGKPAKILLICAPNDLFEIQAPGKYKVTIRFQVFKYLKVKGEKVFQRVVFPPIEWSLVKN